MNVTNRGGLLPKREGRNGEGNLRKGSVRVRLRGMAERPLEKRKGHKGPKQGKQKHKENSAIWGRQPDDERRWGKVGGR